MAREAARKMRRSPNGDHAMVKRSQSGTVQMANLTSGSSDSFNNTTGTTIASTSATNPNLVGFSSATLSLSSGGTVANTPFTLTISRDGSQVTQITSQTTTASVSLTTTTHTTPLNAPTWTLKGQVNATGTDVTVSWTVSRESRWA